MILRRLTQSLKEQNWTAIWIEFILLVTGVFLGIQVSNWNAERVAEDQSLVFTQRLRADLKIEAWNYEYMTRYYREVLANAEMALAEMEGQTELPNERFLVAAYRATQDNSPNRRRATFDELRATGNLVLIHDPTLLTAASFVYAPNTVLDMFDPQKVNSRYRLEFRMRIPMAVQSSLAEHCGDRFVPVGSFKEIANSLDYPCVTGLKPQDIDNAVHVLLTNTDVLPLLRLRVADLKSIVFTVTDSNHDSRQSLKAVMDQRP